MIGSVVIVIGVGGYVVATSGILEQEAAAPPREGEELARFNQEPDSWIRYEGEFRYVFTEDEVERIFDRATSFFHNFRDNMARREINRILNSNASSTVKERASLLMEYLQTPDFSTFQDNFAYNDVISEPWLYQGCYVRWRGRVANLSVGETITFDLMVGYEDGRVLEGVVSAVVPFGVSIDAGESVEVIGQVEVENDRMTQIEVVSIRRLMGEE
jgi:hypothetical protein